jgi:BMFP domain-containing protein YqiC
MTATTTVQIPVTMKARLNAMKIHPRETYADVLERILEDLQELGPETRRAVEKSRREYKAGKYKTLDDVKREMGL